MTKNGLGTAHIAYATQETINFLVDFLQPSGIWMG